jgi:hypothetical protein
LTRFDSWNHLPVSGAHEDAARSSGVLRSPAADLHDDVILLAVLLEARHLPAAEHGFQRAADGVDVDANSAARSRSTATASSGLFSLRSVSTLASPLDCLVPRPASVR